MNTTKIMINNTIYSMILFKYSSEIGKNAPVVLESRVVVTFDGDNKYEGLR